MFWCFVFVILLVPIHTHARMHSNASPYISISAHISARTHKRAYLHTRAHLCFSSNARHTIILVSARISTPRRRSTQTTHSDEPRLNQPAYTHIHIHMCTHICAHSNTPFQENFLEILVCCGVSWVAESRWMWKNTSYNCISMHERPRQ